MGNSALQGFLEENMDRFQKFEGYVTDKPLLAYGQMTNVRDATRVSGALVLAVATGESGELLRLARIDESRWGWAQHKDVTLSLSVIDLDDSEEEAIWASDGLSISQIKFATSLTRYDGVRWLLVQKQTSTTILQPEYHRVPVTQKEPDSLDGQKRLSRIDPKPLITLSHKQTGGNAHVDVAFNPGAKGQPPQLAVIDECGYWSVWDVMGTTTFGKNTTRLSMDKCGHMLEGLLHEIPTTPAFPAQVHGLMFVGTADVDDFWGDPSQNAEEGGSFATRSQHLLLWSRATFEVIDLVSKMTLPRLSVLTPTKARPDWIIDIQVSPVNQNHIFVLTMRHLYWIDLFVTKQEDEEGTYPSVLIACPHLIDGEALRMTTCRTSDSQGQDACMAITYSPKEKQTHTYLFSYSKKDIPQWNRQIVALPDQSSDTGLMSEVQSLEIHSCNLIPTKGSVQDSVRGPGSNYRRGGVRFYQGSILDKDLGVRYYICASALDPVMDISLPTTRVDRSKGDQTKLWKKKRKHFLRHVESAFVFPDGVDDFNMNSLVRQNNPRRRSMETLRVQGPIELKLDTFVRAIEDAKSSHSAKRDVSPALISAIYQTIEDGVVNGKLPLTTWKEVGDRMELSQHDPDDDAAQHDLDDLVLKNDEGTVVTRLGRFSTGGPFGGLNMLSDVTRSFSDLWLEDLGGRVGEQEEATRRDWVADFAREAYLSTYGVMVQDVTLFGAGSQEDVIGNSQPRRSSSIPIMSSQSSDAGIPSSPGSTTSVDSPDAAVQRLQLLAPSLRLGNMAKAKSSTVLSYWPAHRGSGTEDYVSSVAIASESQFDEAKRRLKKIEDRRKAQAEKYKLPAFMRQGAPQSQSSRRRTEAANSDLPSQPVPVRPPAVQTMSSQQRGPDSSQSQGLSQFLPVAMSQPMPGAFGDRKKVKKPKRKSGFR